MYKLSDGRIFKCLKKPIIRNNRDLTRYEKFYSSFCAKLEKADSLTDLKELVLPEEIVLDKKDKVIGYYYNYENMEDVSTFFQNTNDLTKISEYFKLLLKTIETVHGQKVVVPDLITSSNVLYDEKKNIIRLIDYDGLQIGNIPTNVISGKLNYLGNPILKSNKYVDRDGLYTSKIDELSILLDYLFQLTGLNVSSIKAFQKYYRNEWDRVWNRVNREQIQSLFNSIGIDDEGIINGYINLFSGIEENPEARIIIDKLSSQYELTGKTSPNGGFKILKKKRL